MHSQYSALGEELPSLNKEDLQQVLAVFASLGVPCTHEQALVATAAGYDSDSDLS